MNKYKLIYYFHILIPLSIILMPLLPNKYLFYVFPYPIIYYFIWYKYNDCPLTKIVNEKSKDIQKDKNFIESLFNIKLKEHEINNIIYIVLTLSIIISAYKIILSKDKLNFI